MSDIRTKDLVNFSSLYYTAGVFVPIPRRVSPSQFNSCYFSHSVLEDVPTQKILSEMKELSTIYFLSAEQVLRLIRGNSEG